MARDSGYVREVDWLEIFPVLGLTRVITVAADPRKILIAMAGILLTFSGWQLAARGYVNFKHDDEKTAASVQQQARDYEELPWRQRSPVKADLESLSEAAMQWSSIPVWYVRPFCQLLSSQSSAGVYLAAICSIWMLIIWSFCGGAITRLAAVRLTQDRSLSIFQAGRYVFAKQLSYWSSPLLPLCCATILVLLSWAAGLVARADSGFFIVAALWPLGMALWAVIALVLVALLVGWPLMWATISTEGTDAFDGFSRSFSYVTQRPFHYAFYVAVAATLGMVGFCLATMFGELTLYLTAWGVSWGSGADRAQNIFEAAGAGETASAGAAMVSFWTSCVYLAIFSYGHSFLWTAASGIYLLLRRDTDATPLDEVQLDESEDPYGLPPLKHDSAGVPIIDEEKDSPPSS